jgi:hypothetical protein
MSSSCLQLTSDDDDDEDRKRMDDVIGSRKISRRAHGNLIKSYCNMILHLRHDNLAPNIHYTTIQPAGTDFCETVMNNNYNCGASF